MLAEVRRGSGPQTEIIRLSPDSWSSDVNSKKSDESGFFERQNSTGESNYFTKW